ncbi:type II toxin-antitoxin system RelE family toxin [Nostoc sp. MG11]|uniref:type II toxin-antitoxin system RelE family toxin n=1 Tax=Nostoc sp. MG11 TaxID=2721166 RepID=UPI0018675586|nr:hypothetical protein [Nostoc sp. MG11]
MSYGVEFTKEAVTNLEVLASTIQERILRKVHWLSENFDDVSPQALSADLKITNF